MLTHSGDYDLDWHELTEEITAIGEHLFGTYEPCGGLDGYKKAWEKYRAKIMSMLGHGFPPGSRPDAWWMFDSPEPRLQLSGSPPISADYTGETTYRFDPSRMMIRGIPSAWETMAAADSAVFETELEYLARLGLLLLGEKEMIGHTLD